MKAVLAPGIRGYGLLGNAIMATLLKDAVAGKTDEEIAINDLAKALDVHPDQVVEELRKLESVGAISRDTFIDWSEVSSIIINNPRIDVSCCQLSLPEAEKPVRIWDLMHKDVIEFECGYREIPVGDGEETICPPMFWRAAIVAGQEDDTVELSLVRRLDKAEEEGIIDHSAYISLEGSDRTYAKIIEAKKFGPPKEDDALARDAREEAIQYLIDYFDGEDSATDKQRADLGLPEREQAEPPQEEAS